MKCYLTTAEYAKSFAHEDSRRVAIEEAIVAGNLDPEAWVRDCKAQIAALPLCNPLSNWSTLDNIS